MAAGDSLVAEVLAERIDVRVRLYLTPGRLYRIKFGSGLGWAPGHWQSHDAALARLLACESYGQDELVVLRNICRPTY